jgi:hypothetical protein
MKNIIKFILFIVVVLSIFNGCSFSEVDPLPQDYSS